MERRGLGLEGVGGDIHTATSAGQRATVCERATEKKESDMQTHTETKREGRW